MNVSVRIELEPAYVLHSRAYRDTSLLVEALTLNHGRVGLVARGAKKSKSKLNALLQPFRPLLLSWSARGELGTVTSAEPNGPACFLLGRSVVNGFYVNELLMRLLHRHDACSELFSCYKAVLNDLESTNQHLKQDDYEQQGFHEQRALRIFEKNLLSELGYGLVLDHDVETTQSINAQWLYQYNLDKGPVLLAKKPAATLTNTDSSKAIMLHGRSLLSLEHGKLNDIQSLRETKRLMRAALKIQLGDRPLNSKRLLNASGRH